MFWAFLKTIALVTGLVWACLALPLYWFAAPMMVWGAITGWLVSAVCVVAGFYAMCRALPRSSNALMISVFGGMLARLIFIGAALMLLLHLTALHMMSLIASLLGFYMVYMIIELYFVNNRLSRKERYP